MPHATVSAIAMFLLSVAVCEINTYELPNIQNSNLWPWKLRSGPSTIRMNIGMRTYLVNVYTCVQIGASRSSRMFAVHKHTFRKGRTNRRTDAGMDVLPARTTPFQHHRNGVKIAIIMGSENVSVVSCICGGYRRCGTSNLMFVKAIHLRLGDVILSRTQMPVFSRFWQLFTDS